MLGAPERLVRDAAEVPKAFENAGSVAERVRELQERVDAHFNRLAGLAGKAVPRRGRSTPAPESHIEEDDLLRTAHHALAARLAEQQHVFADRLTELQHVIEEERARLAEREEILAKIREEIAWLRGVISERETELQRIRTSRSYRLASKLGVLLRPFGRGPRRG